MHLILQWLLRAFRVNFTFFILVTVTFMTPHWPTSSHSIPHRWHPNPQATCCSSGISYSHLPPLHHCGRPSLFSFNNIIDIYLSYFHSVTPGSLPDLSLSYTPLFQFHVAYDACLNYNIYHIYHTLPYLSASQKHNRYLRNVYYVCKCYFFGDCFFLWSGSLCEYEWKF